VTRTCLQCGAVQPSNVRVCNFCDSSSVVDSPSSAQAEKYDINVPAAVGVSTVPRQVQPEEVSVSGDAWRGELAQKLHAYRARRRKASPNLAQSHLPFDEAAPELPEPRIVAVSSIALDEPVAPRAPQQAPALQAQPPTLTETEDFAFTIAIGRNAATRDDSRMVIDVSEPPVTGAFAAGPSAPAATNDADLFPVASIEERRIAGLIDGACLLFAYGGFLALFGSLGGTFTISKLSAAVCVATFVIVYLQYFALFTVFGGTTPGMMLRGLHVVSLGGEAPTPRQMLLRSLGYMLSAGSLFMGFLWSIWDEDSLTWHDRLSRTYLAPAPTFADIDATHVAPSR
jgi:uncharacterized RDD family membrane protein YckC